VLRFLLRSFVFWVTSEMMMVQSYLTCLYTPKKRTSSHGANLKERVGTHSGTRVAYALRN